VKTYSFSCRIFIQAYDDEPLLDLNELLWNFNPSSFVSHEIGDTGYCPVRIEIKTSENLVKNIFNFLVLMNLQALIKKVCRLDELIIAFTKIKVLYQKLINYK